MNLKELKRVIGLGAATSGEAKWVHNIIKGIEYYNDIGDLKRVIILQHELLEFRDGKAKQ